MAQDLQELARIARVRDTGRHLWDTWSSTLPPPRRARTAPRLPDCVQRLLATPEPFLREGFAQLLTHVFRSGPQVDLFQRRPKPFHRLDCQPPILLG